MTAGQPKLEDRLRVWAEKSGRALELRVARAALQAGANVDHSFVYTDPLSEKPREGDVRASIWWKAPGDSLCRFSVVIECKAYDKKPWVGFYDMNATPPATDHFRHWAVALRSHTTPVLEQMKGLIGRSPFVLDYTATSLVEALGREREEKGSGAEDAEDQHDGGVNRANNAVRQVMSAAEAEGPRWQEVEHSAAGPRKGLVALAAVVTSAPLFMCSLDKHGEPVFDKVDWMQVLAYTTRGTPTRVWVMNESRLPTFFADLKDRAAELGQLNA